MDAITKTGIIGAGAQGATTALGMLTQNLREQRAMKNQQKLMAIQMKNQQELNKQGQELQMKTWQETNYPAQMSMLKEAGLNPALIYGQKGAGGATTGSQGGGSAQSGSAPAPQNMNIGNMVEAAKVAAETALLKAQKENIEADTEKKGAETGAIATSIEKMIAETENTELKSKLIEVQTDIEQISKANRQYQIDAELANIAENTNKLKLENSITTEAYESIIKEIEAKAIGQILQNELTRTKTKVEEGQILKITNEIQKMWVEMTQKDKALSQEDEKIIISRFEKEISAEYPGMMQVVGSVMKKAYDTLERWESKLRGGSESPQDKIK